MEDSSPLVPRSSPPLSSSDVPFPSPGFSSFYLFCSNRKMFSKLSERARVRGIVFAYAALLTFLLAGLATLIGWTVVALIKINTTSDGPSSSSHQQPVSAQCIAACPCNRSVTFLAKLKPTDPSHPVVWTGKYNSAFGVFLCFVFCAFQNYNSNK